MIITAMYLFGIINHAWSFSWWYGLLAFIMDIILIRGIKLTIGSDDENDKEDNDKLVNTINDYI